MDRMKLGRTVTKMPDTNRLGRFPSLLSHATALTKCREPVKTASAHVNGGSAGCLAYFYAGECCLKGENCLLELWREVTSGTGWQTEDGGHFGVAPVVANLGLAYAEHRGSAFRARTFGRGALVLHDYLLWILDLHLLLALHAVCLCHSSDPPLNIRFALRLSHA